MPPPADPASLPAAGSPALSSPNRSNGSGPLARALGVIGLACLVVITFASPGATRMFAWPWSLAFGGAVLAPGLLLMLRAFDSRQPLVLPAPPWRVLALASAGVV